MDLKVDKSWEPLVSQFFKSAEGQKLLRFLSDREASGARIFPPDPLFALKLIPKDKVKVVVLGQDPYHGEGQAHGLAFSVQPGVKVPPSLRNIYKEISRSTGAEIPTTGYLHCWAEQGVLLLNTILTVEEGRPMSHSKKGWEIMTDGIIREIASSPEPTVFMLWGKPSQQKIPLIEKSGGINLILSSNHPSPLSAQKPPVPFIGNNHFTQANEWLKEHKAEPIDWSISAPQGSLF